MTATRKKTTIYLDADLLRAAAELATRTGRQEHEILEDALRQYLRGAAHEPGGEALRDLLEHFASRGGAPDDEALEIAYTELHAARRARTRS